jgi:hypothetical protein
MHGKGHEPIQCAHWAAACTSLSHLGELCAIRRLGVRHVKEGEVNLRTWTPQPISCALLEAELPGSMRAMKEERVLCLSDALVVVNGGTIWVDKPHINKRRRLLSVLRACGLQNVHAAH